MALDLSRSIVQVSFAMLRNHMLLRFLLFGLLWVGSVSCRASSVPMVSATNHLRAQCGNPAWMLRLDNSNGNRCEVRNERWLQMTDEDLSCTRDEDCLLVMRPCGAAVAINRTSLFQHVEPPCWQPVEGARYRGSCAEPEPVCDRGCCRDDYARDTQSRDESQQ